MRQSVHSVINRSVFKRVVRGVLGATAAGAFAASAAVPAAAAPGSVTCGSTLTVDTTLTRNLKCAGTGLTLAPGVTLDLGGFRLTGNGTGVAVASEQSSGNAVVNGRIESWATGVRFVGETVTPDSELTLQSLRVVEAPVYVEAGDVALHDSTLQDSTVQSYYSRLDITRSTLVRSTTSGELVTTTVTDSRVRGGGIGTDENNTVHVVDSVLDGAGYAGIPMGCDGAGNTLVNTTVRNYRYPITPANFCPVSVTGSRFVDNPGGAFVGGPLTVENSTFRNNGDAIVGNGDGDVKISHSTFTANANGVRVAAGNAEVTASTFTRNTANGVLAEVPGVRLGSNRAVDNALYGINAPGAVDLGGNRARDNGVGQCVGVVCAPRT